MVEVGRFPFHPNSVPSYLHNAADRHCRVGTFPILVDVLWPLTRSTENRQLSVVIENKIYLAALIDYPVH